MRLTQIKFMNLEVWSWLALASIACLFAALFAAFPYEKVAVLGAVFYLSGYAIYSYTGYSASVGSPEMETYKRVEETKRKLKKEMNNIIESKVNKEEKEKKEVKK